MRRKKSAKVKSGLVSSVVMTGLLVLLSACGQKGALYLPERAPPENAIDASVSVVEDSEQAPAVVAETDESKEVSVKQE